VSGSLCRLTIHGGEADESLAVDLALPRNAEVGLLLPSIVDLVHRDNAPAGARRWRLSPIGKAPLDESMTLDENHVRDGDLLLLTTIEASAPQRLPHDPCQTVAHVDDPDDAPALRIVAVVAWLCAAGTGAALLGWSGTLTHAPGHLMAGTLVATVATLGAAAARRSQDPLLAVALSVVAVGYAAAVGFVSVPAGPAAANVLLAAAAGFAMAILLLRLTRCSTASLTALACCSALSAATAASCVVWTVQVAAAGATLAVLSLAVLGAAARLSIAVSGLTPAEVSEPQAILAHQTLTGLVAGSSVSAAVGAVLVGGGVLNDGGSRLSAILFTVVVGVVLLLRARTHCESSRRIALGAAAVIGIAAGLAVSAISAPAQAYWITLLSTAAGSAALGRLLGWAVNPVVRRAIELLEYAALAAVLPLACWVVGLYGLVRASSLI
jgi:type VII secretion integral membrane protein EccD